MTIGENIRRIRKEKGYTQKQLAEKCEMYESQIRKYELGKANPKIETIQKIANSLDVDLAELVNDLGQFVKQEYDLAGKVVPSAFTIQLDDKYHKEMKRMKKCLSENPNDPQIHQQIKQLLNEIAIELGSENTRDFIYNCILLDLDSLNIHGLGKVLDFTRDLILVEKYIQSKPTEPPEE